MSDLEEFSYACNISELKESEGKRFYINDIDIALFKVNNKIYAVSNICPHQQAAKIYEGFVEDNCVVCPMHGWKFKLGIDNPSGVGRGLDTYPIKIVNNKIYVKAEEKKLNW